MANLVSRRLSVHQTLFLGIASLLTLFLLYELARGAVPWYDVLGAYLAGLPIGYALAAGLLLGRYLAIRGSINRVLRTQRRL